MPVPPLTPPALQGDGMLNDRNLCLAYLHSHASGEGLGWGW